MRKMYRTQKGAEAGELRVRHPGKTMVLGLLMTDNNNKVDQYYCEEKI